MMLFVIAYYMLAHTEIQMLVSIAFSVEHYRI